MKTFDIDEIVNHIMNKNKIRNFKIQKYYQLKWFLKALETDRYTFQKPSTWDDPFEDFLSQLTNNHKNAYFNEIHITDRIYAMSTIRKESECDGMWKNFAKTTGVLIHTDIKKIITFIVTYLLENNCCSNSDLYLNNFDVKNQLANSIKVEKIEYMPDKKIAELFILATKNNDIDFSKLSFKALSIKRKEFEYENEYRIFLIPKHLNLNEPHFLNVGYFKKTIEKVILAPKATKLRVKRLKCLLTKKYQINPNIIEKSKLYDIEYFKKKHNLN